MAKLNRDLGIAAVHTPPAATDAITDVVAGTAAGHTTYAMLPIPPAAAYLHDGRLVALGVSMKAPLAPPAGRTAAHAGNGVAGFDFPIWYGIWAPAQTPAGIVSTLARDITDTLATPELSEWLTQHDADPMHMSPAKFAAFGEHQARTLSWCCYRLPEPRADSSPQPSHGPSATSLARTGDAALIVSDHDVTWPQPRRHHRHHRGLRRTHAASVTGRTSLPW